MQNKITTQEQSSDVVQDSKLQSEHCNNKSKNKKYSASTLLNTHSVVGTSLNLMGGLFGLTSASYLNTNYTHVFTYSFNDSFLTISLYW